MKSTNSMIWFSSVRWQVFNFHGVLVKSKHSLMHCNFVIQAVAAMGGGAKKVKKHTPEQLANKRRRAWVSLCKKEITRVCELFSQIQLHLKILVDLIGWYSKYYRHKSDTLTGSIEHYKLLGRYLTDPQKQRQWLADTPTILGTKAEGLSS